MNRSFVATVVSLTVSGIAHADVMAGEDKARLCSLFCHNNERYAGSLAPLLEGQPAPYLYNQLKAFKEKRRANTGMDVTTSTMTEDDMRDISEFFAAQPIPATPFKPDPRKVAIGGLRAQDLKCAGCHQPDYKGKDQFPRLAGQWQDYLAAELKNFRTGRRAHGAASATDAAMNPPPEETEDLVHYFAQLK